MNAQKFGAVIVVAAALFAFGGCGKKPEGNAFSQTDISGVKVDVPKLEAAFATAPPEVKPIEAEFVQNIRYGLYDKALQSLDALDKNPALTDPQKKVVSEVMEQMKQVLAKAGPAR